MVFKVSVPDVAGVPPVIFADGVEAGLTILTHDTLEGVGLGDQLWGIYSGGVAVVVADSIVGFDYKQEWAISDYPVEQGAFESFDKVSIPFDARVRFSAGGSEAVRANLLASISAIAGDLKLYDVVTPEKVYESCNLIHYDYRRTAQSGNGLMVVDVWVRQVRTVTSTVASDTQQPSGADPINGGTVQPVEPTGTQGGAVPSAQIG